MATATAMGLLGIGTAYWVYVKSPGLPDRLAAQWQSLYQLSLNKWFVDEAYDRTVVMPTLNVADRLWKRVDIAVIDGAVNGVARAVAWGGWVTRRLQSGQAQNYALAMTVGAVVILGALIFF
jgi:NADH-quinone oxidoreductase subunit L